MSGTIVAIKVLSAKSVQGEREFLAETEFSEECETSKSSKASQLLH